MKPDSEVSPGNIEILRLWAKQAPQGAFVEVGVYKGGTAYHLYEIAQEQGRELYLYDTFEGIPFADDIDTIPVGEFSATSTDEIARLFPEAKIIKGVFPDSLITMSPIAFVHADCDQYRSVKAVCDYMPPLMVDGGVIYFDDYGCLAGATKAVNEYEGVKVLQNGKAVIEVKHVATR